MNNLRHSFLALIGEVSTTYPEAWCLSWTFLGMTLGVALYASIGYWIGGLAGHALIGAWCGLGFYAYWVAQNAERINARIDVVVGALRELRSL